MGERALTVRLYFVCVFLIWFLWVFNIACSCLYGREVFGVLWVMLFLYVFDWFALRCNFVLLRGLDCWFCFAVGHFVL